MRITIPRCYDSHLHLLATGEMASSLLLSSLRSLKDLAQIKISPHHFRGEWLYGFGWDQFDFSNGKMPTRQDLDQYFSEFPVYFIRRDGHAVWINTKAYQLVSQQVKLIDDSGVYLDAEMNKINPLIPSANGVQKKIFLKEGIHILNQSGFTHVRDMSCDETQWNILCELDQRQDLSLYIENNFSFESMTEFEKQLRFAKSVKASSEKHLRVDGMKFYIDGALGSEGAWLSQNYAGSSNCGLQLWQKEEVTQIIRKSWENELAVSVHAIGNRASEFVTDIAYEVWQSGLQGRIHIEHAEVMSKTTIQKLAHINSTINMQPCHWLSDKKWLKQKLGSLYSSVFPWAEIEKSGIKLQWGSDSPIEKPSIESTLKALEESQRDAVPGIQKKAFIYYSHDDTNWGVNCQTIFNLSSNKIESVVFDNKKIV